MDTELPDGFRLLMCIFAASLLSCEAIQFYLQLGMDEFLDDYFIILVALYALCTAVLGRLPFIGVVAGAVKPAVDGRASIRSASTPARNRSGQS